MNAMSRRYGVRNTSANALVWGSPGFSAFFPAGSFGASLRCRRRPIDVVGDLQLRGEQRRADEQQLIHAQRAE